MPNVRVMNWNLEHLTWKKAQVAGMVDAIARTVTAQSIDLLVIVELLQNSHARVMNALAARLNALAPGQGNDYKLWCVSHPTGRELYGYIIRDLNAIRPIAVSTGPTGAANDPITNLYLNTFATYPGTFAAHADAYSLLEGEGPWQGPNLPLAGPYTLPAPSRRARPRFAGEALEGGAYRLGAGFRAPCMAMFEICGQGSAPGTLLPVITSHLNSLRIQAGGQMRQFGQMHLIGHYLGGNYLNVNLAPIGVRDVSICGDFNVNFLGAIGNGSVTQREDAAAYAAVTPTAPDGGSGTPAAQPGNPQPLPGTAGGMAFPFEAPYPDPARADQIPPLNLRIAATAQNTKYKPLNTIDPPTDLPGMRNMCYDNFMYGGATLAGGVQIPCPAGSPAPAAGPGAGDAALVVDPANNIRLSGDPALNGTPGLLDLKGVSRHYAQLDLKGAAGQPALMADYQGPPAIPITFTIDDLWVGARLLSDHVPVVIELKL
jgi:hypothetical protein